MQKIIALLFMKGHSERVPNKNMRLFNGSPLYHSIMKNLDNCEYISKIIIDTDSQIIANDAKKKFKKVHIIERPNYLLGDYVGANQLIDFDISQVPNESIFLQTHSTNPLLKLSTINKAIETYLNNIHSHDSLFSVTKWQTRFYDELGKAINHDPNNLVPTQLLLPIFEENSNLYIFSRESFLKASKNRIGLKPLFFEISRLEAIDIDNIEDFILAETIAQKGLI